MSDFSNGLDNAEDERLSILLEEMGEAIQIIGKINRHGYESRDPTWVDDGAGPAPTNRQMLEKEIGDIAAALSLLFHTGDLDESKIHAGATLKLRKLLKWTHHNTAEIEAVLESAA